MARTLLDLQLQEIDAKIVVLGELVETALGRALQAIQSSDQSLCDLVIAEDRNIDNTRYDVEHRAFLALTLQQPLGGRDLRFLSSTPSVTGSLERIGDNATGIAQLVLQIRTLQKAGAQPEMRESVVLTGKQRRSQKASVVNEETIIAGLVNLGEESQRVLRGTLRAFAEKDAHAARKIWQEDDVVDVCYHLVRHDVMTMLASLHAIPALQQDEFIMQRMTYWLWIAHNLERIGDHCTNICERITFFLERDATIQPDEFI